MAGNLNFNNIARWGMPTNITEFTTAESTHFPNPNTGKFSIVYPLSALGAMITVYNPIGETVYMSEITSMDCIMDLDNQRNGLYFYTLSKEGNMISSGKIVIDK